MVLKGRIPQANYIKYSSCVPRKKNDVPNGRHPETRAVPENNGNRLSFKRTRRDIQKTAQSTQVRQAHISWLVSLRNPTFTTTELTLVQVGPVQEPVPNQWLPISFNSWKDNVLKSLSGSPCDISAYISRAPCHCHMSSQRKLETTGFHETVIISPPPPGTIVNAITKHTGQNESWGGKQHS